MHRRLTHHGQARKYRANNVFGWTLSVDLESPSDGLALTITLRETLSKR